MARLLRLPAVYDKRSGKLPVGRSPFYLNYVRHEGGDEFISGTQVRRLRLVPLGVKARAVDEAEVDRVIRELSAEPWQPWQPKVRRDPAPSPPTPRPKVRR